MLLISPKYEAYQKKKNFPSRYNHAVRGVLTQNTRSRNDKMHGIRRQGQSMSVLTICFCFLLIFFTFSKHF